MAFSSSPEHIAKMNPQPPLKIESPCPKAWEEMTGDAKCRFCDHCQLHVHNLSAMTERERTRFTANANGRTCIAYVVRQDGSMITEGRWTRWLRPLRKVQVAGLAVLATLLPFLFSACATKRPSGMTKGKMMAPGSGKRVMLLGEAPTTMIAPVNDRMVLGAMAPIKSTSDQP